jgi:hypothetical protein
MSDDSREHDPTETQTERLEWDKPELEVIPMREALAGTNPLNPPSADTPFGYS